MSRMALKARHPRCLMRKKDRKEAEASFVNLSRPLTERYAKTPFIWTLKLCITYNEERFLTHVNCSVKSELILKGPFLTIMFPVDRFSEMGPCARTFFSNKGFTCIQVLDYIYAFYQVCFFLGILCFSGVAKCYVLTIYHLILRRICLMRK